MIVSYLRKNGTEARANGKSAKILVENDLRYLIQIQGEEVMYQADVTNKTEEEIETMVDNWLDSE